MKARHTPGPWTHWEDCKDTRPAPKSGGVAEAPFGICAADSGVSIADLWFGTDCGQHISRGEVKANAALIAAAPETLDQLKKLYRAYVSLLEVGRDRIVSSGGNCDPVDVMEAGDPALIAARAAINWAEGR